ncbi:MAG TPA: hypothetical protein VGU67_06330 [Edaphobacter sp.]|nr:hypothetical protein [Edaphobacter sp.]
MANIPLQAAKIGITASTAVPLVESFPPLRGTSTDAQAGVIGSNTGTGYGVEGSSRGLAGVAGLHTAGGNGVYGKSTGNAGCFDGNVQVNGNITVTGDLYLPGADCAEQFHVGGDNFIEPGTVVVVDGDGALRESGEAYDRKVAGVIAGAGEYRPGIVLDKHAGSSKSRAAISLIGKTYCKVDAGYMPIEVGDMLTSSPTPGHAMKAVDRERAFGAVVGKALRPLGEGCGLIPILIALQ